MTLRCQDGLPLTSRRIDAISIREVSRVLEGNQLLSALVCLSAKLDVVTHT